MGQPPHGRFVRSPACGDCALRGLPRQRLRLLLFFEDALRAPPFLALLFRLPPLALRLPPLLREPPLLLRLPPARLDPLLLEAISNLQNWSG